MYARRWSLSFIDQALKGMNVTSTDVYLTIGTNGRRKNESAEHPKTNQQYNFKESAEDLQPCSKQRNLFTVMLSYSMDDSSCDQEEFWQHCFEKYDGWVLEFANTSATWREMCIPCPEEKRLKSAKCFIRTEMLMSYFYMFKLDLETKGWEHHNDFLW
jgi:hypothetical protein